MQLNSNAMKQIIYVLFLALLFTGCEKKDFNWNLPRDNPADSNSNTKNGILLEYSDWKPVGDDNGDNIINKSETVYLRVYIKNNGTETAYGVKATISTTNSYITMLSPTTQVSYNSASTTNDITAGYDKFGNAGNTPNYYSYTVKFKVSSNTPAGTKITFDMNITDEAGGIWTDSFDVTVEQTGAILNYNNYQIVDDDNSDNMINQNETVYLRVYIKNNGSYNANGVKASISTTNSYISLLSPTTQVSYNSASTTNDITAGYEKFGNAGSAPNFSTYTVKFKVSNSAPIGSNIPFTMNISDEAGNTWTDSFTITVQ